MTTSHVYHGATPQDGRRDRGPEIPKKLEQQANVLGAMALVVTDMSATAVADDLKQSPNVVAALCVLHGVLHEPTLEQLRRTLGITHSGTVRIVDRLVGAGLAERRPGSDERSLSIVLTAAGRRQAASIAAARMGLLTRALSGLTAVERETFHELAGKVLASIVDAKDGGPWICRLCDLDACRRDQGECPTATAAFAKYGT